MKTADAEALVDLAERRGLTLSGAPCSLLGETAQTVWKALRERAVGDVRLVYAEQDDGPVHRMAYRSWKSESGLPWPWKDEFEIGCTIEHAGYYLTWLPAFFGPVRRVTAYSTCLVPDKRTDAPLDGVAPDLSIATLEFDSGVVARLTCSLFATHDHGLRIFGEDGVLGTEDCWRYGSPVWKRRYHDIRRRTILTPWKSRVPLVRKWDPPFRYRGSQAMDFCRGVAEMADAIGAGRTPRLSARYCLHVNEVVLAISNAGPGGASHEIRSRFDPIEPMPWAV